MKKVHWIMAAAMVVFSASAIAHGPTRQKVEESIAINAPVDKVWALVGDFSKLHEWHPAVKSTDMTGDDVRLLTLQDGNTITEEIKRKNDDNKTLSYKITDMTVLETVEFSGQKVDRKTLPVDNYTGLLKVEGDDQTTTVSWVGKFYPAWLYPPPVPEGMTGEDGVNAISAVYKSGLENLKTTMEATLGAGAAVETKTAVASASGDSAGGDAKAYEAHLQCEGDSCKIDKFLTVGFRTFGQCQVCHGIDGNGSTIAPSLLAKIKELDKTTFYDRIENGYQGQIGVMPPWKTNPNVMKNIDNLYQYLDARADGKIPAGKVERF